MSVLLEYLQTAKFCRFNYNKPSVTRNGVEIQEFIKRDDLPTEYIEELVSGSSLEIFGPEAVLHFFSIEDLRLINDDPAYTSDLPFLFFFGTDNGDRFYAFDPANKWDKGPNAVFMVPKGMLDRNHSRFLGNTLIEVVEKINAGIDFSDIIRWGRENN